jgi:hypothetical protein
MALIPSQDSHRYVAILNETPAVQTSVEPVAHASRLVQAFAIGPVSGRLAKQAKGLSHLGLSFVGRPLLIRNR